MKSIASSPNRCAGAITTAITGVITAIGDGIATTGTTGIGDGVTTTGTTGSGIIVIGDPAVFVLKNRHRKNPASGGVLNS
jgi:hypothetical protein